MQKIFVHAWWKIFDTCNYYNFVRRDRKLTINFKEQTGNFDLGGFSYEEKLFSARNSREKNFYSFSLKKKKKNDLSTVKVEVSCLKMNLGSV